MRIAQIATLASPVGTDAQGAGSVECLVSSLARHLVADGHEVTVFAAGSSVVPGELVATLPGPYGTDGAPEDWQLCEWINLCRAVEQSARFDVLHSHAYLWGLPLEALCASTMVHTLHVWPYGDSIALRRAYPHAFVTAPSAAQWRGHPELAPASVVPHGIEPDDFTPTLHAPPQACYLGRFLPGKGPLEAIEAARAAEVPLVMAGPASPYFDQVVRPAIEGTQVRYAGPVTAQERTALLGSSGVLVAPWQAPEPFGLVMVEAMMCGTPVVTTSVGAGPEIIEQGVTGYHSDRLAELPVLLRKALSLNRAVVRARAEARFSAARMAEDYLTTYAKALER